MQPAAANSPPKLLAGAIKPPEEFSDAAIDNWIRQLPWTDMEATGLAVHNMLRTLNLTDNLSCDDRIRITEQVRPIALSLTTQSSENLLSAATLFPLPQNQRQPIQQNIEICLELAGSYRRIMTSGTFFSENTMRDSIRARIIFRSLQACGQALLHSLECYESPPLDYWREVYTLYRFAEGHQLQYLKLSITEYDSVSIDSQFKQILLLALSNHQRHRPDEIRSFYSALIFIAQEAEISDENQKAGETALFYFDLVSDTEPRLIKPGKTSGQANRRYLFTTKMAQKARQHIANPAYPLPERFRHKPEEFLRLLDGLNSLEKRRFARKPDLGTRKFVVGFANLLTVLSDGEYALKANEGRPNAPSPQDIQEPEDVILAPVEPSTDIWLRGSGSNTAHETDRRYPLDDTFAIDQTSSIHLAGWILNSSATGCCLLWFNRQIAAARVGELIGIYQDEYWIHIGVIRWMHQNMKLELAFGVDLLSPTVEIMDIETKPKQRTKRQGFYLAGNEKLGQPARLLVEAGIFKTKNTVLLKRKTGDCRVRLESILESTPFFELFSLASL